MSDSNLSTQWGQSLCKPADRSFQAVLRKALGHIARLKFWDEGLGLAFILQFCVLQGDQMTRSPNTKPPKLTRRGVMPGSAVAGTPASRTWAGPRLGHSK